MPINMIRNIATTTKTKLAADVALGQEPETQGHENNSTQHSQEYTFQENESTYNFDPEPWKQAIIYFMNCYKSCQ